MYADLEFYHSTYCNGREPLLTDNEFLHYEQKAAAVLNRLTFGRICKADDNIRFCVCAVAEQLQTDTAHEGISSENNDGYSVSYTDNSRTGAKLSDIVKTYLSNTDLLYRGF